MKRLILVAVFVLIAVKVFAVGFDVVSNAAAQQERVLTEITTPR